MGCANTLRGSDPTCPALKKKGGFDKRIWVGNVSELDSITYGSNAEVTAFTFAGGKGFKTYSGQRFKHGAAHTVEVGPNANMRIQNFNAVFYARLADERSALEELIDAIDVFIVAEGNHGQLEIYGINKGDNSQFDNYGLGISAVEKNDGILLNDETSAKMTFTGHFDNFNLVYKEGTALATNITTIDAQVV